MVLLGIFVAMAIGLFWVIKTPSRWLSQGKLLLQKQQDGFYIEEVGFADYKQALHHYFQLADDVTRYGEVLESKFSFLDWTYAIFRFSDCTVSLVRNVDKVRLIKSPYPLEMAEFEQIIGRTTFN